MYPITELLLGGSIRTPKSGVLLENIDRVDIDHLGYLRIRGYVRDNWLSDRFSERWTTLDTREIDLDS